MEATLTRDKSRYLPFLKAKGNYDGAAQKKLQDVAGLDTGGVLQLLDTTLNGITPEKAAQLREKYGYNEIRQEKAPSWIVQLGMSFIFPFNGVLVAIAAITYFTDVLFAPPGEQDFTTIYLLFVMILLSSLIRFWQEFKSNQAAETLKKMIKTTATVLRLGAGGTPEKVETDISELVPGDMISLSAGDMIPADCRVLLSKDLFISQSMLTGESLPVEKQSSADAGAAKKPPLELDNMCFMGTNVASGTATAVIVVTGSQTYFGSLSKAIVTTSTETSFDKGVKTVSFLLIRFMLVMVPLVLLINGFTKHNWFDALLFAISVAVGLTPEMLPMIVTTNLAKGAVSMSRKKVIVKKLNAIQNIGAMDILCTDKTGTLTLDKIVLERHLNIYGVDDDEVLKWAYLNSYHQTGLKNLMDLAVLEHKEFHEATRAETDFTKLDEIPFDFHRRRMSVILRRSDGKQLLICKGAVEEMLAVCSCAFDPGDDRQLQIDKDAIIPLNDALRESISKTTRKMNEEGLRVLIIAIREFDDRAANYAVADECKLTVAGFIGFLDPAKPSAKGSLTALQELGIRVKVLTGDNEVVTRKICNDVGVASDNVMLGAELEKITDDELGNKIDDITIFAKLSPFQKSRIIKVLQDKGHTVGFMGDGINDAAALHNADVGISVDTATDIAKESADIILLENDLMVLREGVLEGRRTFGNIIKYIKMAASSNFGNMFSVLGASALLPFLPMMPIQILLQNLLYDISQISIPWDTMDKDYLDVPRKWDAGGISKFMFFIGPISSIFDYVTFAVMFFVFKANTTSAHNESIFQSGWFIEGLLSQTLIVHMIRTRKIPFIQSWAAAPVVALTTLIMFIGVIIPFTPMAGAFKMTPLPMAYFPWLAGILLSYCILTQMAKVWFIRKYNQWM